MKLYELWDDIASDALKGIGKWLGQKSRSRIGEPGMKKIPSKPSDNNTEEYGKSGFTSGSATKWDRPELKRRQRNN